MKGLGKPLELLLYHFPLVLTITDFLVAGIIIILFCFFYKGKVNWCDVIYEILLKIFYLERKKNGKTFYIFYKNIKLF